MRKQKAFYYTSKDYINREYTEKYYRVSRWIRLDSTIPRNENKESEFYFRHNNRRYYLNNFMRIDNAGLPSMIYSEKDNTGEVVILSGYESDNYYKPLFIELSNDCDYIRLYQYNGSIYE